GFADSCCSPASVMSDLMLVFLHSLLVGLRRQAVLQAEIIALQHQLTVLQRAQKPRRLVLNRTDRCFWVWLSLRRFVAVNRAGHEFRRKLVIYPDKRYALHYAEAQTQGE